MLLVGGWKNDWTSCTYVITFFFYVNDTFVQSNCVQCNEIKCHHCIFLCQLCKKLLNIFIAEDKVFNSKDNSTTKTKRFCVVLKFNDS